MSLIRNSGSSGTQLPVNAEDTPVSATDTPPGSHTAPHRTPYWLLMLTEPDAQWFLCFYGSVIMDPPLPESKSRPEDTVCVLGVECTLSAFPHLHFPR